LKEIAVRHKAQIVNTVSFGGIVKAAVVEISFEYVTSFVQEVKAMELASYVEPNMRVQVQWVPNDPYWTYQWGPKKIMADWAWNTTTGSSAVLVAVVDTGIYYYHEDLAVNYAPLGRDWVNMDEDPLDDHGHGTHCAGIIAAAINNSIGIAGLAQVRIMAEKVLDSWGYGYADWVANGIIHATDCGAKIISMSLGGYGYSELLHEAVKYAYDHGVLIIAAAGNDNTNMKLYPAGYDEVIAVAATDQYDNKAWFSNWGDWIELAAPGVDIYSTVPWGYESWSGTSMATPHVSGVAALVWSLHPNKTRDWVRLWLRYTADDLGGPGFDVYYGYGRINARKAVEQAPPLHELIAYEWTTPPFVKPGAIGTINATVLNFGESNETDVMVQLLANSTVVGSASIEFLESGDTAMVSFAWNPMVEGLYNVTLYAVPVPGETSLENNVLWKYIYVGFPVKAVVLHSAGNVYSGIITNWQVLSSEWYLFGDTMVYVDYITLNKEGITYEDIANTEADVLIISCAYDPYAGWEFTDSEIEAIKQYVYEGHGLIVTAGTFYYWVPNNNKLAPLFGLNETVMWTATGTNLLHLINTTHPLFNKVPNPLVFPLVGTALPYDGRWDQNELVDGKYLALGHYRESAIVVRRGLVYISPWLEIIPAYYHHHLQLLYNAITWSRYQKPQHELEVSLQAPKYLQPSESAMLNATVYNMGLNNETNVELYLLIDGVAVNSTTISELLVGASYTFSYLWTPIVEGIYNVTAYAPPVPNEKYTRNNVASANVKVCYVIARVAVLNSWDIPPYFTGGWSNDYQTLVNALNAQDFYAQAVTNDEIIGRILNFFDVFVMVDNVPNEAAVPYVVDFWLNGGGIVAFDSSICFLCYAGILPPESAGSNGYYVYWDYETSYQARIAAEHPITEGYEVGQIIYGTPEDAEYRVDALAGTSAYPYYMMLVEDVTRPSRAYVSAYEPLMTGKVVHIWDQYHWSNTDLQLVILNAMKWAAAPRYEHDLAVSLGAPAFLELGNFIMLNATVRNRGLHNETDVELYLMINGTIVSSAMIPELVVGESYTINYLWTLTSTGKYNITAYAPPVSGEDFVVNNVATKMVIVTLPIKVAVLGDYYSQLTNLLWENGIIAEERGWDVIADIREYNVVIINRPYDPGASTFLALIEAADEHRVGLVFTSSWPGSTEPYGISLLQWYLGDPEGQGHTYGQGSVYYQVLQEHPIFEGWGIGDIIYIISRGDRDHAWFWGYSGETIANIGADYTGIRGGGIAYKIRKNSNKHLLLAGLAPQVYANLEHWTEEAKLIFVRGVLWASKPLEHDLAVTVDAPSFIWLGDSALLNATVTNRGLNNETNLELQLLINGTIVDSMLISELPTGASYTLSYLWAPTGEATYNITAYVPPVSGEDFVVNNVATKMVIVMSIREHDVAVTSLHLTKTIVGQGYTMNINVTVANQGGYTETFNVTLYANTTAIQTRQVTLANKASTTLTYTWNTTGFAKGNYAIWAYAWPVPGETDTADNTFTNGSVYVDIPGDVNGDRKVDGIDLWEVARRLGTIYPDPRFNPNMDIDNNKKIDGIDMWIIAKNFGRIEP
jgi:thermitase